MAKRLPLTGGRSDHRGYRCKAPCNQPRTNMPQKSKWFRVATEGATTDGRAIERSWIEQMAKNFSQAKYGARVWIEHMRGLLPDSAFAAQGDVVAVKAEAVEDGKLALFAQIKPLESLVAMNKAGQKLYTSIEVDPNFAGTGEAYLVGLASPTAPPAWAPSCCSLPSSTPQQAPWPTARPTPTPSSRRARNSRWSWRKPQRPPPRRRTPACSTPSWPRLPRRWVCLLPLQRPHPPRRPQRLLRLSRPSSRRPSPRPWKGSKPSASSRLQPWMHCAAISAPSVPSTPSWSPSSASSLRTLRAQPPPVATASSWPSSKPTPHPHTQPIF